MRPIRTHEEIVACEHWILGVDCAINNASCFLHGFHSSVARLYCVENAWFLFVFFVMMVFFCPSFFHKVMTL